MDNGKVRVLLIEDDPDGYYLTRDLLSEIPGNRIELDWLRDFDAGLAALGEASHDACLLDYRLGPRDGLELLRESQRRGYKAPVILLTGLGDRELALKALDAGAADYLVKGKLDAVALERSIRHALQQRRHADELEQKVADRTEALQRVNAALQSSEERYRLMVEGAIGFAIIMLDVNGLVTNWNVGAERLLGYIEAEVLGHDFARFFTPEDIAAGKPRHELHQARHNEIGSDDNLLVRKDGSRFWASGATTALRDEAGNLRAFSKIVRDVTERKRSEEALKEADRHKNEFLAMLAHELRNPLAPISNAVQILQLTEGKKPAVEVASRTLHRQVGQMVRLVDDLLDMSRVSQGKIELRLGRVDLTSIVNEAVGVVRSLSECEGRELKVTLPQTPLGVHADPARLMQVLGNLLSNACKFTDPGGRIGVTVERDANEAVIRVRDNGIGIAHDQLPRIFEMFAQVDRSLERTRGGLGIGLTLVRQLIGMHGGSVQATSDGPGKGSEFALRLPALADAPEDTHEPAIEAPAIAQPVTRDSRRILVVDDNRDAADSLALLLRMTGNDVRTVHDGLEALRVAETAAPEVILLDLGLPKLNGYDVARRIREQPWGARVVLIALTGWGQEEDRERSKDAGFDHHLVKPVDHVALDGLLARGRR